jgi:hypothetical protein
VLFVSLGITGGAPPRENIYALILIVGVVMMPRIVERRGYIFACFVMNDIPCGTVDYGKNETASGTLI